MTARSLRLLRFVLAVVGIELIALVGLALRVNNQAAESDRRQDAQLLVNCLNGNESRGNIRGGLNATADALREVLMVAATPPDAQVTPAVQARIDAILTRFDGPLSQLDDYAETFTQRDCTHLGGSS